MQHVAYKNLDWITSSTPDILKAGVVQNSEGGGLSFWQIPKGSGFSHHSHKGYEYIYLIQGQMNFSGIFMKAGDFLLTSKGEEHEAIALEESVILVVNERRNS